MKKTNIQIEIVIDTDSNWNARRKRDAIDSFNNMISLRSKNILLDTAKAMAYHEVKSPDKQWLVDVCREIVCEVESGERKNFHVKTSYPVGSDFTIKITNDLPEKVKNRARVEIKSQIEGHKQSIAYKIRTSLLRVAYKKTIIDEASDVVGVKMLDENINKLESRWSLMALSQFNKHTMGWFEDNGFMDFNIYIKNGDEKITISSKDILGHVTSPANVKKAKPSF